MTAGVSGLREDRGTERFTATTPCVLTQVEFIPADPSTPKGS